LGNAAAVSIVMVIIVTIVTQVFTRIMYKQANA
jgi:hypothetical protein